MFYVVMNKDLGVCNPGAIFAKANPDYAQFTKSYFEEQHKDVAEKFAEWCAQRTPGDRFYLAHVIDFVQTTQPPVKWNVKAP